MDENSIFTVYKKLIEIREKHIALQMGNWKPFLKGRNGVIAYKRIYKKNKALIILNFTPKQKKISLPLDGKYQMVFSTYRDAYLNESNPIQLGAFEAIIFNIGKAE
jgi:glucan 1,6-alpha-glucosidase